ncbi:MAG: peptide deformylase [Pseudomonadota bacterium]
MAVRPILEIPDPRLRRVAQPVTEFDDSVLSLVEDLRDTLYTTTGIGLCAPQLGDLRQILVMDLSEDHSDLQVFINPVIHGRDVLGMIEESCLSIPDVVARVVRPTEVDVSAVDQFGKPFETHLSGMSAVCLQHEMDHLAGRLFVDRLSLFRRLLLKATGKIAGAGAPQQAA